MEHRIGRQRPAHIDIFREQSLDRRADDIKILASQRAAFAGMGVQACNDQSRPGYAIIPRQCTRRNPRLGDDKIGREQAWHVADRAMDGDRDGPQAGTGEHHNGIGRGNPAAFGDKFGLARIVEADVIQLRLGYRPGHYTAGKAVARQSDGNFQAVEGAARTSQIGIAGRDLARIINLDQRQGGIEGSSGIRWRAQRGNRAIPDRRECPPVTNGKERREIFRRACGPGSRNDFGPDAGGVAD